MRLYRAICAWFEARAEQLRAEADRPDELHPEGDNFAQAELAHRYTTEPELHLANRGTSIDYDEDGRRYPGEISLKWRPTR